MFDVILVATLEDMRKTLKFTANLRQWVVQRTAHAGLRCQIHNALRLVSFEELCSAGAVSKPTEYAFNWALTSDVQEALFLAPSFNNCYVRQC